MRPPYWTYAQPVGDPNQGHAAQNWQQGRPFQIGGNVDGYLLNDYHAYYRNAVRDQYSIVTITTFKKDIAPYGQDLIDFSNYPSYWQGFDNAVRFACQNRMAIRLTPFFWDHGTDEVRPFEEYVNALGGDPTVARRDAMWRFAYKVLYRLRALTPASQCPDLPIYIDVINEPVTHQEWPHGDPKWFWNQTRNRGNYDWVAWGLSATRVADDHLRQPGQRAARLFVNETAGAENLNTEQGQLIYNRLVDWKSYGWQVDGVGLQAHLGWSYIRDVLHNYVQASLTHTMNQYGLAGFETQLTEVTNVIRLVDPGLGAPNRVYWQIDNYAGDPSLNPNCNGWQTVPYTEPGKPFGEHEHAAQLVAAFRACRDSSSCTAFVTWGVMDHYVGGNDVYHAKGHLANAWMYGPPGVGEGPGCYGYPQLLDCLHDGGGEGSGGGCDPNATGYHRKTAWWYIWSAIFGQ